MSHASAETLAAYWLGELAEQDALALEDHFFECDTCTAQSARMAVLPRALAFAVPPVVSSADAARLLTLDARIRRTEITPGGLGIADFSGGAEAQLLVLKADLSGATQVDVTLFSRDGTQLLEREAVPFDAHAGTITVACRGYYLKQGGIPLQITVRVEAAVDGGRRSLGTFDIDHIPPV
jgi:anti-sigma factor RsiW